MYSKSSETSKTLFESLEVEKWEKGDLERKNG